MINNLAPNNIKEIKHDRTKQYTVSASGHHALRERYLGDSRFVIGCQCEAE